MSSLGSLTSFCSLTDENYEDSIESEVGTADQSSTRSITSIEDIQEAVAGIRRTILETEENSEQRRDLVHRLIKLKIKQQDLENRAFYQTPGEVESMRHALVPCFQKRLMARSFCDECCCGVWPLLQTVYECRICSYLLHAHCMHRISRRCVGAWLHPLGDEDDLDIWDGSLLLNICPEVTLVEQNYACAECGIRFHPDNQHRLCDYTGRQYCQSCHWGSSVSIPARIVHNWDFTPMQVCQAALQYLTLMRHRPVIDLSTLSPGLSVVTAELSAVVGQRRAVLEMKKYLVLCRLASSDRLLRKLEERQHFIESENMFSIKDLMDTHSGQLGEWLGGVLDTWRDHITSCLLCKAKGFICELCPDRSRQAEILFPFSVSVEVCPDCEAVFHRECFRQSNSCPRCQRKRDKQEKKLVEPL